MTRMTIGKNYQVFSKSLIIGGLVLSLSFGAHSLFAQQNQPEDSQSTVEPQQTPGTQPTMSQPGPQQASQPGYDQAPMQGQQPGPQYQAPPNQMAPPASLTLPAGTVIRVRVDEWLSSDRNYPGDTFSATLDQPVVVNGWVVARRGQSETGHVSMSKKAGRVTGTSQLGLQLTNFTLVDGQQLALQTQLLQTSAGTSHGQDAGTIGATTGVGAAIGAVADGGAGAAIGAGAGAVAGIIGVLGTRGKPTVIPPETVLSFRLDAPVTISTDRSQSAFQPVSQDDYNSRPATNRQQPYATSDGRPGYPPPPPPYYGYPYAYGYPYGYYGYYPAPYAFGFYGGYGFGGRFGGYRGGFRR